MPRHTRKPSAILPAWVKREDNDCLRSVAEDAYVSRALAESADPSSRRVVMMDAAEKALRVLEDAGVATKRRCAAGDVAARKYWNAANV